LETGNGSARIYLYKRSHPMTPVINTAHRTHTRHDATGRKPAQPANDRAWPFRHMQDPREERK